MSSFLVSPGGVDAAEDVAGATQSLDGDAPPSKTARVDRSSALRISRRPRMLLDLQPSAITISPIGAPDCKIAESATLLKQRSEYRPFTLKSDAGETRAGGAVNILFPSSWNNFAQWSVGFGIPARNTRTGKFCLGRRASGAQKKGRLAANVARWSPR